MFAINRRALNHLTTLATRLDVDNTVFQQCGRVVKSAVIDGESDQHGHGSKPSRVIWFGHTLPHCSLLAVLTNRSKF